LGAAVLASQVAGMLFNPLPVISLEFDQGEFGSVCPSPVISLEFDQAEFGSVCQFGAHAARILDSGASSHIQGSMNGLIPGSRHKTDLAWELTTCNGPVRIDDAVKIDVPHIGVVNALSIGNSPDLLSMGRAIFENQLDFNWSWKDFENPALVTRNNEKIPLTVEAFCPMLAAACGLNSDAFTPDETRVFEQAIAETTKEYEEMMMYLPGYQHVLDQTGHTFCFDEFCTTWIEFKQGNAMPAVVQNVPDEIAEGNLPDPWAFLEPFDPEVEAELEEAQQILDAGLPVAANADADLEVADLPVQRKYLH
jgi:hypothetical protein